MDSLTLFLNSYVEAANYMFDSEKQSPEEIKYRFLRAQSECKRASSLSRVSRLSTGSGPGMSSRQSQHLSSSTSSTVNDNSLNFKSNSGNLKAKTVERLLDRLILEPEAVEKERL